MRTLRAEITNWMARAQRRRPISLERMAIPLDLRKATRADELRRMM